MTSHSILTINNATKNYGHMQALHGISIDVSEGEFIALVGPSGSGKSTLLKCIAGFEDVTTGTISIDGKSMTGVSPAHRPTSMVFQKLALFPHKTIADNIAFPLKLKKVNRSEINLSVQKMMDLMSLKPEYLKRYPHQLSGGEQQRVALARSMISSPKLLLLDEPLSALDVKLKKVLQGEIKRLHRELGVTFVHVTHDLEEAMMLADRICVMNHGLLEQIGTPHDIYYRPETSFVAGFISETNLFDVMVEKKTDNGLTFSAMQFQGQDLSVTSDQSSNQIGLGHAKLMVRPERLRPLANNKDADFNVKVTVAEYFIKGSIMQFICMMNEENGQSKRLILEMRGEKTLPFDIGSQITLGFDQQDVFVFQERNQSEV